ncbi:hypothetical protein RRG08_023564 [Elysia crispata]|uniref:Mutator-like transposase domain-containing protein n=1 Tax=Elysia crispata TaxID=231223 RepID=A0AAE1DC43_9GAST|nr:hypothetical protein RRG08_023564 [Elysia crispata]
MENETLPGKKTKERKDRPKKRKFHGNKYTTPTKIAKTPEKNVSRTTGVETSSSKKLQKSQACVDTSRQEIEGFRFVDISTLINFVVSTPCKNCLSQTSRGRSSVCTPSYSVEETLKGVNTVLIISCNICNAVVKLDFSPNQNINMRFQFSMYSVGVDIEKSNRFLACMDMPKFVSPNCSASYRNRIHAAVSEVSSASMSSAAEELKDETGEATVSCDGTWQRRGFSSKNGVATVISVPKDKCQAVKVVDVEVLSNYCDTCAKAKCKKTEEQYRAFSHDNCQKNHTGSAGSMEPEGMVRIFARSEDKHGLQYTNYLGDGDSKSYRQVCEADVYNGKEINKLECCGHVQKRMGKRLMDKVAQCKGQKFQENGKAYTGIGGAGRLTSKAIKPIQGHYGGAIRKNCHSVEAMRKSIWSIFHHRGGRHDLCGDWCKKDNKNVLPQFVLDEIEPIFQDLSSDALVSKCTHGGTQNTNESFHNLIWNRCPKNIFVGRQRLEIAVLDAAVVFNDGELGRCDIFKKLNLSCGKHMVSGLQKLDSKRIKKSAARSNADKKVQRQRQQHTQNNTTDETYEAGAF